MQFQLMVLSEDRVSKIFEASFFMVLSYLDLFFQMLKYFLMRKHSYDSSVNIYFEHWKSKKFQKRPYYSWFCDTYQMFLEILV